MYPRRCSSTADARIASCARWCIDEPGDVAVLGVADRPVREAGPGEVRIAVRAAAVNPTDIGLREHGGGAELPPPWIPGMDAAGIVESVGEGVDRPAPGDEVMAALTPRARGRRAGRADRRAGAVRRPGPEAATLQQASTLPMNGLTAMLGLELLGLRAGQTLAVTGGAGLLASYVIPLAARRGIRTLADASPADEPLVRSFGPDVVVPRGDGFCAAVRDAAPDGADGVYDTALLGQAALPAIRDGGAIAVVRGWDGSDTGRGIEVRQVWVRTVLQRTDWLSELRSLACAPDGPIKLRVAGEYPPERVGEAHRLMSAGGLRGRAVIVF